MKVKPAFDVSGQLFGRLTAIRVVKKDRGRRYYWLCRCRCGRMATVRADCLKNGTIGSCGCLRVDLGKSGMTIRHALQRIDKRQAA